MYAWDLDSRSEHFLSAPNKPLVGESFALGQTEKGDVIFGSRDGKLAVWELPSANLGV